MSELAALIDWTKLDGLHSSLSAARKGEPGWPPLALFRALLSATWHDLSDVRVAEAVDERSIFRRFCGFAAHQPTPKRTAFARVRAKLVRRGMDRSLCESVTRQVAGKGVVVWTGALVNATLIPPPSIQHDKEAGWTGIVVANPFIATTPMSRVTRKPG